jgi:hypothetical protein
VFSLVCVLFAINVGLFVWHREFAPETHLAAAMVAHPAPAAHP